MATPRYWNANYWNANYWEAGYWAQTGTPDSIGQIAVTPQLLAGPTAATGSYFPAYFADGYFADGYFAPGAGAAGGTNFTGTFLIPNTFTGTIAASTSTTGLFTASAAQVVFFDLQVGFSSNWSFTETSTYTGAIANTLDDAPSVITGLFSADYIGTIAATLGAEISDFNATHAAPPNVIGPIAADLGADSMLVQGLFVPLGGATGSINVSLEAITSDIQATWFASDTDGTLADTLNSTATWRGNFYDAAVNVGLITTTLDDMTTTFSGSSIGSALVATRRGNVGNTGRRRGTNTRRVA